MEGKMKIGFDIDSTLNKAHYFDIVHGKELCKQYGFHPLKINTATSDVKDIFGFSEEMYNEYMRRYFPWNVKFNKPESGYHLINSLYAYGHTNGIITARRDDYDKKYQPYKGWMMKEDTLKWLHTYGISFSEIHFSASDKLSICKNYEYDILVDDDPKNIIPCADNGIRVIIKGQSYNEYLIGYPNTYYAYNLYEVVDIIKNIQY